MSNLVYTVHQLLECPSTCSSGFGVLLELSLLMSHGCTEDGGPGAEQGWVWSQLWRIFSAFSLTLSHSLTHPHTVGHSWSGAVPNDHFELLQRSQRHNHCLRCHRPGGTPSPSLHLSSLYIVTPPCTYIPMGRPPVCEIDVVTIECGGRGKHRLCRPIAALSHTPLLGN